jgi:hypothetical protein
MPHMRDHSNRLVFKDRYSNGHLKKKRRRRKRRRKKNEMTIVTYSSTYEEPLVILKG